MIMALVFRGRAYTYLFALIQFYVVFQLISDATAGKIIDVFSLPVSVSVLYFPLTFVISDVLTEVYGYACAKRTLWIVMASSITAGVFYKLAVILPSPAIFDGAEAYTRVFGVVPRILLGGWIAVFAGETANNYVLARMKVLTGGKWLWTRTIGSTLVGQGVNTLLFYVIGLYGTLPNDALLTAILAGWAFKVAVEAACTPFVYIVVARLKRIEQEDHFDRHADFNPFRP